jgi:Flp pilus assembly protein TadD
VDHYEAGRFGRAKEELLVALKKNPSTARGHYYLAQIYVMEGREELAMVGYGRAIALEPAFPEAYYNLGTLHLRRGESVAAAEMLEEAARLRPSHAPTFVNLGNAYFLSGVLELSVAAFEHATELDPYNIQALTNLEMMARAAGEEELAEDYAARLERAYEVHAETNTGARRR